MKVSRAAVLAYRAAVHEVERPVGRVMACAVLGVGVQDTPPGTAAPLALRARVRSAAVSAPWAGPGLYDDPSLALVHSVRGTAHLHRAEDIDLLAAALRPDDADDLLLTAHGGFFRELAAAGVPVGAALDAVAGAMAEVMSDGWPRDKGTLSTALTPLVPERLAPWCPGCGVRHVHDGLFRMATLQAGLRLAPVEDAPGGQAPGGFCFLPGQAGDRADGSAADCRRELVRRFLRLSGPVDHRTLGNWLAISPAAARRWWSLLDGELAEVTVDGRARLLHADDLPALTSAPRAAAVRLLPPHDPVVELADRELLVPDPVRRRQVWRAVANPGLLLVAGEIAGTWRRRRTGDRTTVTVSPFAALSAERRRRVTRVARDLVGGPGEPEITFTEP